MKIHNDMMNVLLSFIKLNIHLSISLFFIILIFSILIKEDFIVFFLEFFCIDFELEIWRSQLLRIFRILNLSS